MRYSNNQKIYTGTVGCAIYDITGNFTFDQAVSHLRKHFDSATKFSMKQGSLPIIQVQYTKFLSYCVPNHVGQWLVEVIHPRQTSGPIGTSFNYNPNSFAFYNSPLPSFGKRGEPAPEPIQFLSGKKPSILEQLNFK